jgi:hypothetical protein
MPVLATLEAKIRRIMVQNQPRQNSSRDPISTNGWAWWCTPVIPVTQGSTNRRIVVQASLGVKKDLILKTTSMKRAAQGSEFNPPVRQKKKKKKKREKHPIQSRGKKKSHYAGNEIQLC